MSGSPTGVRRASGVMAFGTLASRLTGALRTFVLTGFALDALFDTYQQANTYPNMVYELVAGGVLSATLIPLFTQLLAQSSVRGSGASTRRSTQLSTQRGAERALDGMSAIVTIFAVVIVVASLGLAIAAPYVMRIPFGASENADKLQLGTKLLRLFAPQVAIYGFVTITTALLQVRRRFLMPMLAPVLNNVVVIIVVLWVQNILRSDLGGDQSDAVESAFEIGRLLDNRTALLVLGIGTTAGVLAQALPLLPALRSVGLRWHWEPSHPAVRELGRLSTWTLAYVVCNMISLAFVQRALARVDGDYATYATAYSTFFLLPHGLFAVSIASAVQPELAEAFLRRKRNRFRRILTDGLGMQITVMVPSAFGLLVLAGPIARSFRFGAMTVAQAERLSDVLRAFAIGLPFFSVYLLLINACKALRDTRVTFIVNAYENAANIFLATLFLAIGWGAAGVALSFALAYVIGCGLAFVAVRSRLHGLREQQLRTVIVRVAIASAIMATCVAVSSAATAALFGSSTGRGAASAQVGVGVVVGVSVYLVVGRLVGVTEIARTLEGLTRRLGRRARSANTEPAR